MGAPLTDPATPPSGVTVVIPTIGRPSLAITLSAVSAQLPHPRLAVRVLVVDDRRDRGSPLDLPSGPEAGDTTVLPGSGRGPAAARNIGWRAAQDPWVVFLDDDVVPALNWLDALWTDLTVSDRVGGVQGRIRVPLPDRPATDWERCTAGLANGAWITADMAYRRAALATVGGFDERFRHAFREDAELAYRVRAAGWLLRRGSRTASHPVRPERPWISLRTQRGNADDALLRRLYGPRWRPMLDIPPGRRPRHAAVTAAGLAAAGAAAAAALAGDSPRWRRRLRTAGWCAIGAWLAGTAEFAAARIRPGPGTPPEVATMAVTSAVIPVLASAHWLRGWWAARGQRPLPVVPVRRTRATVESRDQRGDTELMFTSRRDGQSTCRATTADQPTRG